MGVRKTESRIPGGFDKASELGYAKHHSPDNNYVLISHLPKDLRVDLLEIEKKQLFNRYHLFVNTINVDDNIIYSWKISFFRADQEDPFFETESKQTEYGYFILTSYPPELTGHENKDYTFSFFEHADLFAEAITKIIVQVSVLEPGADLGLESNINLSLEHNIISLNNDIESLMSSTDKPFAKGGNPETTRKIANDYKEYLTDRTWGLYSDKIGSSDVPLNLVASTLYLNLTQIPEDVLLRYDTLWESYINDDIETSELYNLPLGIGQIIPNFVAMFIPSPDNPAGNTICPLRYVEDSDNYDNFLSLTFTNFNSLYGDNEKDKIDIINLARFPKSAIKLMELYLFKLIENSQDNESLCDNELIENRPCLTSIITEYFFGPYRNEFKIEKSSNKYFNFMFFLFIQELIKTSKISYELLKVKILDIRSGLPVKNTLIKRIVVVINPGDNERKYGCDTIDFMNDVESDIRKKNIIQGNDSVILKAQKSLNLLGYHHGNSGNSFGLNGRVQYNKYWQDRSPDRANPIYSIDTGNPKEVPLEEIIKEYKMCGATDENGCLNIKIPTAFLNNKKMHIEIGFWDFPIVCEALLNEPNMISRLTDAEAATKFIISWIGNDANNKQELEWEKNIKHEAHFGWEAKKGAITSQLRVAKKLIVKNDLEEFTGFKNNLLSKFFNQYHNPTHFVLFGMQWCQPVWDEYDSPSPSSETATITNDSYAFQNGNPKITNMHLVTMWEALANGSERYGGKGYGFYEFPYPSPYIQKWRGGDGHKGLDIHGVEGESKIFAIHGGWIFNSNYKAVFHQWPGKITKDVNGRYIRKTAYKHLDEHKTVSTFIAQTHILSGQIIAISGRTGNINQPTPRNIYPSHLHLDVGYENNLYTLPDDANKICVPYNEWTPLLFPCKCQVFDLNPKDCKFQNNTYINDCWAVAELKCPHMNDAGNENRRLQAQLRWMHEVRNNDYLDPGPLNGVLGDLYPGGAIHIEAGEEVILEGLISATMIYVSFTKNGLTTKGSTTVNDLNPAKYTQGNMKYTYNETHDVSVSPYFGDLTNGDSTISQTRKAIYTFKSIQGLLTTPNPETILSNYEMSTDNLNELDKEENAKITPPT